MPRHLLSITLLALVVSGWAAGASAQAPAARAPRGLQASVAAGRLEGTVVDDKGAGLDAVVILAMGTAIAGARTDSHGRFSLDLPAGQYVVHASREGYISTYREPMRIQGHTLVERRITLTREAGASRAGTAISAAAPVPLPSAGAPAPVAEAPAPRATSEVSGNQSEIAWRLRHLPPTVLRDVRPGEPAADAGDPPAGAWRTPAGDAGMDSGQTPLAAAFFSGTEFTGQINMLTSTSVTDFDRPVPTVWSHGVADVIVGAPVGTVGDWSVRAAMGSGNATSWTLLGEYKARPTERHALKMAVSYGSQGFVTGRAVPLSPALPQSRSAGGVRIADRWTPSRNVEVTYGGRFDRYDYLATPNLAGGRIGGRARIAGDTSLVAGASRRMVAPGSDQFLPPSASGPWLPPTRTFSSLVSNRPLTPEGVTRTAVGFEQRFGLERTPVLRVEWFSESADNQMATLFGLDKGRAVGHYYLASPGSVDIVGLRVVANGTLVEHVRGTIEYVSGRAEWTGTRIAGGLRRRAPAVARRGTEPVTDLRTAVDVALPRTSTHLIVELRLSAVGDLAADASLATITQGRFNFELRQRLPYQPLGASQLNLLLTVRTLLHDDDMGSLYDEILTVHPPARVTGGLQVRF